MGLRLVRNREGVWCLAGNWGTTKVNLSTKRPELSGQREVGRKEEKAKTDSCRASPRFYSRHVAFTKKANGYHRQIQSGRPPGMALRVWRQWTRDRG